MVLDFKVGDKIESGGKYNVVLTVTSIIGDYIELSFPGGVLYAKKGEPFVLPYLRSD